MDTLFLDFAAWDLSLDALGNLATAGDSTASNPQRGPGMRLAQDVATRCRSWLGEVYYDTTQGIRYADILGTLPNLGLLQSAFNDEALKVPSCATAISVFSFAAGTERELSGTINVADINSNAGVVTLT